LKKSLMFGLAFLVCLAYCGAENRHLESSHFIVSYASEIEGAARASLEIAEETAETLASYFGYDFAGKKIVLNVSDESDFSNGFARTLQRYVGIDIRKSGILWRGETPWLRNVIAHELSHKYTLDVLKRPIYLYAAGDLWVDEEGVEGGGSCSLEHNRLPYWFVEGLAQVGAYRFEGDRPDPYREMLLRDAFLHGRLLSLEDMARFERSSREAELVYNQGFYFLLFILDHEPMQEMSRFLLTVRNNGLEKAALMMYGVSLEELYREWVGEIAHRFSGFPADEETLKTLCPQECYPFVSEIASTADGRYVISNWGSDYADYSLFEKRNGSYRRLADNVGTVLKQDPVSGAIWYNRLVYEAKNDRERFELFKLAESGRPRQILEGTRTRAFDVYDDTVALATYQDGVSRIEQYNPDTDERRVLYELPFGSAVYSVCVIEGSELLVAVGDGKRIRLFRSAGGEPVELWPEVEADILDAVYAGGGRIVFTSTIDGTPQIYAADLDGPVGGWRRLTDASGGAMRPVFGTTETGETVIVCTVYEDGCFKLRSLAADWEGRTTAASISAGVGGLDTAFTEYGKELGPLAGSDSHKTIGETLNAWERTGLSPLVLATPIWTLEYGMDDDQFDEQRTFVHTLSGGALLYLSNAADTIGVQLHGGLEVFLGKGEIDGAAPFANLLFEAELPFGTISQELSYQSYRYFSYDDADQYAVDRLSLLRAATSYAFPLARYCDMEIGYSYLHRYIKETYYLKEEGWVYAENGKSYLDVFDESLAGSHEALIGISRSKQESTYDPAYLGRTGSLLQLSATGILSHYYDAALLLYGIDSKYDPSTALELAARISGTLLSPGRKASLTCQVRGIGYLQDELPEDRLPYLYLSLGRQGYATGYDYFYPAVYFAQGELDFRINPFLDPFDSVKWYERFSLGIRAEGGIAYKLDSGDLKAGYPLSLELALRGGILVNPKREAYLYFKAAFPMTDKEFFETDWSSRYYFGFSL
jgi:hypothetical protein